MSANWQVFLALSSNLERVAEISTEARGKSFRLSKNQPGNFSFNIPLSSPYLLYSEPYKFCTIVQKDSEVVWSGPIHTREIQFGARSVSLECVGWFQILVKRFLTADTTTYEATNDGEIAFDLLNKANAQTVGGVTIPTWITEGVNTSSATRDIEYEQFKGIGEAIQELTDIESGFDFEIDPATREMNISAWDDYSDRTDAVFGYNWGPKNLLDVSYSEDGDAMQNQLYVVGTRSTAEAHDTNTDDVLAYNLHQEVITISDLDNLSIQAAIANEELAFNKRPRVLISLSPMGEGTESLPQLFTDYDLGDKCYLTAETESLNLVGQGIRVFGVSFDIDNNGNEKVTSLETTYTNV